MASPVRILYVLHTTAKGGSATSLANLVAVLTPRFVEPFVVGPAGPGLESFRRIGATVIEIDAVSELHALPSLPLRGPRLAILARCLWKAWAGRGLRRVIAEVGPELVHLNDRGLFHAAWLGRRAGVKVVAHARAVADRSQHWLNALSQALMRRHVDQIIAIDESVRHSLRELPHVEVVYNPLRVGAAAVPRPARSEVRVTYLSGLHRMKGVWDVAECASRLGSRKDIVFQIAGQNAHPAAFYRSAQGRLMSRLGLVEDVERGLAAFVERHRLAATVRLLGWVTNIESLLAETDILLFPSHLNGLGRSVFEAGAMGIPSVVTLADPIGDIVEDGVTGRIVGERDHAALAAAVEQLTDDAALRRRMGDAARERCLRLFDPQRSAGQVRGIYDRLLADPPERRLDSVRR